MTKPSEAPNAFPLASAGYPGQNNAGMTIWDIFAIHAPLSHTNLTAAAVQAAQELPRNATPEDRIRIACASQAFIAATFADVMLAERAKRESKQA